MVIKKRQISKGTIHKLHKCWWYGDWNYKRASYNQKDIWITSKEVLAWARWIDDSKSPQGVNRGNQKLNNSMLQRDASKRRMHLVKQNK